MIDTNKYLDGTKLLIMEHEEAKRIIAQQGADLRQLRADLEAAKKATQTAQDLVEQTKAANDATAKRNAELAQQAFHAEEKCKTAEMYAASIRKQFDPELKAAELAAKAAELERLKAQAERLAAELKGGE